MNGMTKPQFIDWLAAEVGGIVGPDGFIVSDYDRDVDGVTVDFEDGTSLRVSVSK